MDWGHVIASIGDNMGSYDESGWPTLTGDYGLTLNIKGCRFTKTGSNSSHTPRKGCFSGIFPRWTFEDCVFSDCTVNYKEPRYAEPGCFFYITPDSSGEMYLKIRRCVLDNAKVTGGVTQSCLYLQSRPGRAAPLLELVDVYFYWNCPHTDTFTPIVCKRVSKAEFRNVTAIFSSPKSDGYIFQVGGSIIIFSDCDIRPVSGKVRGVAISDTSTVESVSFTECNFTDLNWGLGLQVSSTISLSSCVFQGLSDHAIHCTTNFQITAVFCIFTEAKTWTGNAFIHLVSGPSKVSLRFCCFQTRNSQKRAIYFGSGSNVVDLIEQNCFSHSQIGQAMNIAPSTGMPHCGKNFITNCNRCEVRCPTDVFSKSHILSRTVTYSETVHFMSTSRLVVTSSLSLSKGFSPSEAVAASEFLLESFRIEGTGSLGMSYEMILTQALGQSSGFSA
jgi:hypothetical protein